MIHITRLNHHPFVVNSDWIKLVEQNPDTVITLLNGEKIVVLETAEQIIERVIAYRRLILDGLEMKSSFLVPVVPKSDALEENSSGSEHGQG